mgnify:CR=1 FL=1
MKEYNFNFYSDANLKSYNLNESIRYQLGMLDSLDAFTRRHSENVAALTCRLCEKLHMRSYFTAYCTTCAYLHDIGKQFIPEKILQKNGPLTDEEYEIMKTHTTIGYKICMADMKLRPYANGTLYHHEALNGTGYPNGATAQEIPLEGKIIRVADEFDAIVSKRQYKSHVGISDTLKILFDEITPPAVSKKSIDKLNKIDPKIFKALVKNVIEDTEYEIGCLMDYIDYIDENIKRLHQIQLYNASLIDAKKDHQKEYYKKSIELLLDPGETLDNWAQVASEYKTARAIRSEELNKLRAELKKIKKFK